MGSHSTRAGPGRHLQTTLCKTLVRGHLKVLRGEIEARSMEDYLILLNSERSLKRDLTRCGPGELRVRIKAEQRQLGNASVAQIMAMKRLQNKKDKTCVFVKPTQPRHAQPCSPGSCLPPEATCQRARRRRPKSAGAGKKQVNPPPAQAPRRRAFIDWQARVPSFPATARTRAWISAIGLDVSRNRPRPKLESDVADESADGSASGTGSASSA